jgi:hypothetical protein
MTYHTYSLGIKKFYILTFKAKMMAGGSSNSPNATAAAMEAYMQLACFSAGISPVAGTSSSAGTSAKSIRKPKTSLMGIKKSQPGSGSVTKPLQRKSLDPKIISSAAVKTYLGANK